MTQIAVLTEWAYWHVAISIKIWAEAVKADPEIFLWRLLGVEQSDDQLPGSERLLLVVWAIAEIAKPPASHLVELGHRIAERFASRCVRSIVENA
jgi:hypothetical protein